MSWLGRLFEGAAALYLADVHPRWRVWSGMPPSREALYWDPTVVIGEGYADFRRGDHSSFRFPLPDVMLYTEGRAGSLTIQAVYEAKVSLLRKDQRRQARRELRQARENLVRLNRLPACIRESIFNAPVRRIDVSQAALGVVIPTDHPSLGKIPNLTLRRLPITIASLEEALTGAVLTQIGF
jgi:hypothetical protein